jgi:hypothetical protein
MQWRQIMSVIIRQRSATGSLLPAIRHGFAITLSAIAGFAMRIARTFAEVRMHRAMIEAELYRNRYIHTSKNDDDLPIVR